MKTKLGWAALFAVVSAGGFALWWQRAAQVRLQAELAVLVTQNGERERLQDANRRLAENQPAAAELETLRAHHAALPQLRAEIAALHARERSATEQTAKRSPERFAAGAKVPAGDWRNAGAATSRAALETILWGAAGGDIDAFAQHLFLPDKVRPSAIALLESLPADVRGQYATPERLIAFLACKDVPLGAAQVVAWHPLKTPTNGEQVRLQLSAPDGNTRDVVLQFAPHADGWKLVVPHVAIAKYVTLLKGPSAFKIVTGSTAKGANN
jgi:hypothetical protein